MEYAVRLISLQQQMESYLSTANSEQFIRLGATITVGAYSISPIVKRLKQDFEHIRRRCMWRTRTCLSRCL